MLFIDALASVDEMAAFGALGTTPKVSLCTTPKVSLGTTSKVSLGTCFCAVHSWEQPQHSIKGVGCGLCQDCSIKGSKHCSTKGSKWAGQICCTNSEQTERLYGSVWRPRAHWTPCPREAHRDGLLCDSYRWQHITPALQMADKLKTLAIYLSLLQGHKLAICA